MVQFDDLFSSYRGGAVSTVKREEKDEDTVRYDSTFADVTQLLTPWGEPGEVFKTSQSGASKLKLKLRGNLGAPSLVLRRTVPVKGRHTELGGNRLELHSEILRTCFQECAKNITSIPLHGDPIIIPEPYSELYFCRDQISKAIEDAASEEIKNEVELLKIFEREYMSKSLTAVEASVKEGLINIENLWALFKPGTLVLLQNRKVANSPMDWCATVQSFEWEKPSDQRNSRSWVLAVTSTDFNGTQFGTAEHVFSFATFTGSREICSLPAIPLSLLPESDLIQQNLLKRGRVYEKLCRESARSGHRGHGSHKQYDGPMWSIQEDLQERRFPSSALQDARLKSNFYASPSYQEHTRIIVDPGGLFLEIPRYRPVFVVIGGLPRERPEKQQSWFDMERERNLKEATVAMDHSISDDRPLEEEELITLPPRIFGFSLDSKEWCYTMIDNISNINWNDNAYEGLQMEPRQKDMVRRLVDIHEASTVTFNDFIPGKGRGLVFLLHGPPGCGKTMTAESVSASLHRALYCISPSDLIRKKVYQEFNVEEKLTTIFRRVARWEAILLFDEADAFLKARSNSSDDRERIILTSALLRLLEYQAGITFLTTNRVVDFDAAFYSRVHITLHYKELEAHQRRFIWENLSLQMDHELLPQDFDRLSRIPLNGRSIKNVLRVASLQMQARGRSSGGSKAGFKLGLQDVKDVLRYSVGDPDNRELAEQVQLFYGDDSV
ncbi:P-loop containing nucleoside triphosphate hydrolase protein [Xylariomycetidae sp. FL2044]|nr:P-loop containing nucleoside triphosphate hydrolase protein [Xylariomycetidae sp. FL2044]